MREFQDFKIAQDRRPREAGVPRRFAGFEQTAAFPQEQFDQQQEFPPFFDAEQLLHIPGKVRVEPLVVEARVGLGRQERLREAAAHDTIEIRRARRMPRSPCIIRA